MGDAQIWRWDAGVEVEVGRRCGSGTQAGTIIYSIQTGQYSGELSANFD